MIVGDNLIEKELNEGNRIAKASIWYLISNFILKAVGFLTTPFFSRILTVEEYGYYSNFATWVALITIIASLSMYSTLLRARFDYKDDLKRYIFSILVLGSLFTVAVFGIIFTNSNFFSHLFVLDKKYLFIMFLYIVTTPAYEMFLNEQRYEYRYKTVVVLSVMIVLLNIGLSFGLIAIMEDNLLARVIGSYFPTFVISVVLYIRYFILSKSVKVSYWKYALPIAIPYIFHLLSSTILSTSDRTMITKICGASDTALYSMAYNLAMIVNVMWSSLNSAFAPWMTEKLHIKDYDSIKRMSYPYIILFTLILIGIMLVAPEAILILGGEKYHNAIYVIPPVMYGYYYMLIYSLYVNIEQFEKKTLGMAAATAFAAVVNIILNLIFIPKFGFIAAAYTTLTGYILLTLVHFRLVKRMKLERLFNTKFILLSAIITGLITFVILLLYSMASIRRIIIAIYVLLIMILSIRNKNSITRFIKIRSL